MCSLQYTVYYSQLFNFNVIYKSSYRNKLWQHIEFKTNRNDLKSRKSCTRPKFKNYLFKHPTDCFGYRKSSLQVSNTVPEFTFGTGLHCFIWRSKSVARPWQEPYLCQEIGFLQFVSIVWYDVNILGYFGENKSPYLPTHWRNGGPGVGNEHIFIGDPIKFLYSK